MCSTLSTCSYLNPVIQDVPIALNIYILGTVKLNYSVLSMQLLLKSKKIKINKQYQLDDTF